MNAEPSAKTGYTVLGGAAVTIIVWIVTTVTGIEIPAEIAAAATTLVSGAIALLIPAKSGKYVAVAGDLDWDRRTDGSMADYATEDEAVEVEDN